MEIEFYGGNCFKLKTKDTTIVIDDNLNKIGKKSITTDKVVAFYTSKSLEDEQAVKSARLVIDAAGEFEVGDLTVRGIQVRAHIDTEDQKTATVFQFMYNNQTATIIGHIHPDISDEALEVISGTDVLILPIGGNGFTLDITGAASIIKKVEPDIVIPSQYAIKGINYEVPAIELEEFGKVAPLASAEKMDSFKLSKSIEDTGSQTKVVVLNTK
ncbi:MBL fold metallo-hydrolase [Candidatus Saccharibacteria bacterium]|nr:MBL fold metallo-hydrolase [Candidatus Saccharibacteria bacterium]